MKLVRLLRGMNLNVNKYIAVNKDGTGFIFRGLDDLIAEINTHSGANNLNATKIDGKTIDEFIESLKTEFKAHEHANKDVLDTITQEKLDSWNAKQDTIGFTPEDASKNGVADGYVSLDSTGKIPLTQLPAIAKETMVVPDTAAKSAITADKAYPGLQCLVLDDDAAKPDEQSVLYICVKVEGAAITWAPIAKLNQSNVTIEWSNIQNKPNSSVSDIDDAVAKKHEHDNIATLNKFATDHDKLTYDGKAVSFSDEPIGVLKSFVLTSDTNGKIQFALNDPSTQFNRLSDRILAVYYNGLRIPDTSYEFNKDGGVLTLKDNISLDQGELLEIEFEKF